MGDNKVCGHCDTYWIARKLGYDLCIYTGFYIEFIQDLYKISGPYKFTSFKEIFKETIFTPVFILYLYKTYISLL